MARDLTYIELAANLHLNDCWVGNSLHDYEMKLIMDIEEDFKGEFTIALHALNQDKKFKKLGIDEKSIVLAEMAQRIRDIKNNMENRPQR